MVRLTTNRLERVDVAAELFAEERVLVVERARRHDDDHLVRFEGVAGRNAAEELKGLELSADPIDDPDELWVHDLIASTVVDQSGVERGQVVEVLANPASDLLVLESGALVPARFVVSMAEGRIDVDVPDGLFDL